MAAEVDDQPQRHLVAFPLSVKRTVLLLVAAWLGGALLFGAIHLQDEVPVAVLTKDPQTTTGSPWYLGLASSFGIVGWSVAATILGLGAVLRFNVDRRSHRFWALATASALTVLMLLDDMLLLHDDVLLDLIGAEEPVFAAYAVAFGAWFLAFRREIDRGALLALGCAIAGFGASVGIDVAWDSDESLRLLLDDGAKFVGIWSWVIFAMAHTARSLALSVALTSDATD